MDIQFVLDPYACVQYILNYINKAERGISLLLRKVVSEFDSNLNLRQKLKSIAKEFVTSNFRSINT
jgi:hypothetical protein